MSVVWFIILVLLAVTAIASVLLAVLLTIDWLCGRPLYMEEPVDPRMVAEAQAYHDEMQRLRPRPRFRVIDGGRGGRL